MRTVVNLFDVLMPKSIPHKMRFYNYSLDIAGVTEIADCTA